MKTRLVTVSGFRMAKAGLRPTALQRVADTLIGRAEHYDRAGHPQLAHALRVEADVAGKLADASAPDHRRRKPVMAPPPSRAELLGPTPATRRTLNIPQAAAAAQVSRRTIYNWIAAGKVEIVRGFGGGLRVYADSLWRY